MSDLVPFVTAILRDRTVTDLSQQNKDLKSKIKEQEDEQLLVQITGSDGKPVHYKGSLKNGVPSNTHWFVTFSIEKDNDNDNNNDNSTALPVDSITGLEIWLGGTCMECLCAQNMSICNSVHPTNGSRGWVIHTDRLVLFAVIGPVTAAQHTTLPSPMDPFDLTVLRDGTVTDLIIRAVIFKKNAIRGSISLLESLGISTSLTTMATP